MTKKPAKLVLVMPPQIGLLKGFSTGLISLANYVEARLPEIQTDLLELSAIPKDKIEEEIIKRSLVSGENLVIGITTTTASYQAALEVARVVKRLAPTSTIVLGGHHASGDAEVILRSHTDLVDFIVVGEGERSLTHLLTNYAEPSVFETPGLAFLHNGKYYQNPSPSFLTSKELDGLSLTFRGNGLLKTPGKFDHVTYVSARGCPLRCAFCSVANERIRAKSVPQVINDIKRLTELGFSRIAIEDNFFAHSPVRTRELCEALAELRNSGEVFSWDCQTRVESMAREGTARLLAAAGCEAVYIGVESLNSEHLLYLNKVSHVQRYLDQLMSMVVPELLDSPVDCFLNLQFGLPRETDEHVRGNLTVLASLGEMAAQKGKVITIFPQLHVVYPGTAHFNAGVVEGRFPKNVFESFTQWEAHQSPVLTWLGEHFAHGTGGLPEGLLIAPALRRGDYEVDVETVLRISSAMKGLTRLPGISVFNYGAHLVESESPLSSSPLTLRRERTAMA